MLMRKNDSKGIVKFDFITSCLAFRSSIPTSNTRAKTKYR